MHESLNEMTLQQAFELYRAHPRGLSGSLQPATISDIEYTLRRYAAPFWNRPIASISSEECTRLFKRLTHVGPRVANKTMGYLRTMIDRARRYESDDDTVVMIQAAHPVTLMLQTTPLNQLQGRHGLIPKVRVRGVWRALKELGESAPNPRTRTAADWLRFMLMTGMRQRDSRALRFSYVDWRHNVIEVPGNITKNCHALVLPMAPRISELLEHRHALHRAGNPGGEAVPDGYIFASDASSTGHIMSARATLKAVAGEDTTYYDIRRTFVAIAWECAVNPDVLRRVLNNENPNQHRWDIPQEEMLEALVRIAQWLDQPPANRRPH